MAARSQMPVRFNEVEYADLDLICEEWGLSRAETLRRLVTEKASALKKNQKRKSKNAEDGSSDH